MAASISPARSVHKDIAVTNCHHRVDGVDAGYRRRDKGALVHRRDRDRPEVRRRASARRRCARSSKRLDGYPSGSTCSTSIARSRSTSGSASARSSRTSGDRSWSGGLSVASPRERERRVHLGAPVGIERDGLVELRVERPRHLRRQRELRVGRQRVVVDRAPPADGVESIGPAIHAA